MTGRFGLGWGAEAGAPNFKVPLKTGSDLFTAVCVKGADTLITDATVTHIGARLPAWYRASVNAPAFLLPPMQMKGAPFELIHADKAQPRGIELGEKELSLLRTLRNHAVMAFKRAARARNPGSPSFGGLVACAGRRRLVTKPHRPGEARRCSGPQGGPFMLTAMLVVVGAVAAWLLVDRLLLRRDQRQGRGHAAWSGPSTNKTFHSTGWEETVPPLEANDLQSERLSAGKRAAA